MEDNLDQEQSKTDNSGKMATVHYAGFFDDGSTFMTTEGAAPIRFPCVEGWMPPEFIEAVRTMVPGETRQVRVEPETAYDIHREERVMRVKRADIPAGKVLPVGEMVNLESPDGQTYPARVVSVNEEEAVFDMNPDAIAKALNFRITLLSVEDLSRADKRREEQGILKHTDIH